MADFKNWSHTELSTTNSSSSGWLYINVESIPRDGYVTLAVFGNHAETYAELQVLNKVNTWVPIQGCYGTDYWDNINHLFAISFHGFVTAGTRFRIAVKNGSDKTTKYCYLWE